MLNVKVLEGHFKNNSNKCLIRNYFWNLFQSLTLKIGWWILRLCYWAVQKALPNSKAGSIIRNQLIAGCISQALHYDEVQAAESRGDFIRKMEAVH